jgi:hypothetical protein
MKETVSQPSSASRCGATNRKGEPSQRSASINGFCVVHAGKVDMRAIGRKGGKARTRPGMKGKQLAASLRERLRASIDEDRLAEVLVSGLESESAKERLDVAKLILAELAAGPKLQGWVCTCASAPGEYCHQLEEHGYRSIPKHVSLGDVLELAVECGMVEAEDGAAIVIDGERVDPHRVP